MLRASVERLDRFMEGRLASLRGLLVLDTTLLAEDDPPAPAYYAMAGAISFSGVHVELHHATDVVAGSIIGVVLGRSGAVVPPTRGAAMRRLECVGPRRR